MLVVYFMTPVTQTIRMILNSRMTVNKELERMWKEMIILYFKVLFLYLRGGTEWRQRKACRFPGRDSKWASSALKPRTLLLDLLLSRSNTEPTLPNYVLFFNRCYLNLSNFIVMLIYTIEASPQIHTCQKIEIHSCLIN
jgi:hypothetical protein